MCLEKVGVKVGRAKRNRARVGGHAFQGVYNKVGLEEGRIIKLKWMWRTGRGVSWHGLMKEWSISLWRLQK